MMSIEEVLDFVGEAKYEDLEDIKEKLVNKGVNFDCPECDSHDDDCDCYCNCDDLANEARDEGGDSLARELITQGNSFGFADMLDILKREGERIGVFLKVNI